MKANQILQTNLLDIIFENRNKAYGAYPLRKLYNKRLYKALSIMLLLVAVLCISITIIPKKSNPQNATTPTEFTVTTIALPNTNTIKTLTLKQPHKPTKQNTPHATKAITTTIKIVTHTNNTPIQNLNPNLAIGIQNHAGTTNQSLQIQIPKVYDTATPIAKTITNIHTPQPTADIMPTYPGGTEALKKYLEKNIQNPSTENTDETITVKIRFIVGYDGTLKTFETIQDGGTPYTNEVIRVLKKMPQWIPGKTNGQNVSVYYTIPVVFTPPQ